jgi:hypothetical protein
MELTSRNVQDIFMKCLFLDREIQGKKLEEIKHVKAEGVISIVGFHPERLECHRQQVKEMLSQLPKEFSEKKLGDSFVNMPFTKDGHPWGSQTNAEQLMQLGIGLKMVEVPIPRTSWKALPGGVPYLIVKK